MAPLEAAARRDGAAPGSITSMGTTNNLSFCLECAPAASMAVAFLPPHFVLCKVEQHAVCYWSKQLTGVLCGIFFGMAQMKGLMTLAVFGMVNLSITWIVVSKYVSEDPKDLQQGVHEGFMPSIAGFLLTWIITNTAVSG